MKKVSDMLNKPVISKSEGTYVGAVQDVYFDEKCRKIAYFVTRPLFSDKEERKAVAFAEVTAFSDALTVDSYEDVSDARDLDFTLYAKGLTGMRIFGADGSCKGEICDITTDDGGKTVAIITESDSFAPQAFAVFNECAVLKEKTRKKRTAKRIPRPDRENTVTVLQPQAAVSAQDTPAITEDISSPVPATETEQNIIPVFLKDAVDMLHDAMEQEGHTPYRVICEYDFLLGRKLAAPLTTYSGEPIASAGEIVTDELVHAARKAGKLVELTLNSVKADEGK